MTVELDVAGKVFEGFESGTVQLTLNEAVNSFEANYVADPVDRRAIFAGDEVAIRVDGEELIAGYVDTTSEEDDEDEIRTSIGGRSKAGDLADCSAIVAGGGWTNATLDRIVTDLCSPFGISAFVESPGAPFATFAAQPGETVYDTIARGAAKRGLIVYSVGGDLVLARAGQHRTRTVLERGGRVIRSGRTDSWVNRYSQYVFAGQARPTDTTWGKASQQLKHVVSDPGVRRFRPLRVTAETGSGLDLQHRAELERNQRAGRGEAISCVVEGYHTDEGHVWRPNTLVHFRSRVLGVDATLLIAAARFRFGYNEEPNVELELVRPEAYDLGQYPALGRGEQWI